MFGTLQLLAAALAVASVHANVSRMPEARNVAARQDSSSKLVFAHFMVGIVGSRASAAEYDDDMKRAKSAGIDAFALNIGTDDFSDDQLKYAYESAANNDMKVFISFDFNWFSTSDAATVGGKIADYASKDGQLLVDDKPFFSTFAGDGLDVQGVRDAAGVDIFFAPNFAAGGDMSNVDAGFNWIGWPNNGNNKAPNGDGSVSVDAGDQAYLGALGDKSYLAPASPWFFTHYGPEVSYSKNWVFPGDLLWYLRWREILALKPSFVEIVTWNDFGEGHYIGPLSSTHGDDGNSKWVNDMPHTGWLEMAKPFIAAYKAGEDDVTISDDQLIYWYRPTSKDLDCDSTDTTMGDADNSTGNYFKGRPDGYQTLADDVFVVTLLTEAGTVLVNSGGTAYTYEAPKGASAFSVPFSTGAQSFSLSRGGSEVISATSLKEISEECPCGLYNFNAYVGTVPESAVESLDSAGLASLTNGLLVDCEAKPSLPATPPQTTAATETKTATAAATDVPI